MTRRKEDAIERLSFRLAPVGTSTDAGWTDLLTVSHLVKPQTCLCRSWDCPMGAGAKECGQRYERRLVVSASNGIESACSNEVAKAT